MPSDDQNQQQKETEPKENNGRKAVKVERKVPLKTIDDIADAGEWLFNEQKSGRIDSKTADGMNTTLKGLTYIKGKLRIDVAKLLVQAQIKKVAIPEKYLPEIHSHKLTAIEEETEEKTKVEAPSRE